MQGLQVFDSKGRCTFDMTKRLTRIIGKIPMGIEGAFFSAKQKKKVDAYGRMLQVGLRGRIRCGLRGM